jgi:hypothetical protein
MRQVLSRRFPQIPALCARAAELRASLLPDGRDAACDAIERMLL